MRELPKKFKGKDLKEALSIAAESLKCDIDSLEYNDLGKEKKGFFGIGSQCHAIEVTNVVNTNLEIDTSIGGYFKLYEENEGIYLSVYPPENRGKYITWKEVKEYLESQGYEITSEPELKEIVRRADGVKENVLEYVSEHIIDGSFDLEVKDQNMKALLNVALPQGRGKKISRDEIYQELNKRNITYNVDFEAINRYVENGTYSEYKVIAQGKEPVDGEDAKIQIHFEKKERKPVLKEDGSVDYYNIDNIINVKSGDVLATKEPPSEGTPGKDIFNKTLPPKQGKDKRIKAGKHTVLSEDEMSLQAEIDGQVSMNADGLINVFPVYEVSGDVGVSTGNIDFVGNVIVKGQVTSGLEVKAAGDILIKESIDSCYIEAGGNVDIKGGMQGRNKGKIKAEGSVTCKFIENATVEAGGDVRVVEGILHSHVKGNSIYAFEGRKGLIVGGEISANEEVISKIMGSNFATNTEIEVGLDPKTREKKAKIYEDLKNTKDNIEKTDKAIAILQKTKQKLGQLPQEKENMLIRLQRTRSHLITAQESLNNENDALTDLVKESKKGVVKVLKTIHPGVKIVIGEISTNIKDEQRAICYKLSEEGEITSGPVK
ncbi:FapA family protein [Natranaerobius trueperi]|uniref:RNA-binding protein KhpB N-terminal domain-containing protein n=1 Tax=Natranaerobius trueperi TaxID=759412 RepID=A0A226BZ98_9FIRM|nr:FapA family protein [Natranaerobius trueperi]OWZ84255.1 hypothetical protein CDO51_04145 [Natranaerobius trueperi]